MKDHDHLEEKFFTRKERKIERKIASKTDRSKFKKTDREKKQSQPRKEGLLEGRVLEVRPEEIVVMSGHKIFSCTLKGKLKKERQRVKNLVVVGDFVFFEESGGIVEIEKRRSQLSRKTTHRSQKEQIIASNIDLVLITASCVKPPLDPSVIDRFIIAATSGKMEPVIVINKIDLLEDRSLYMECLKIYHDLGLKVFSVSALTEEGLEDVKREMMGKASLFAGASGVGKSSLINALTGLNLHTQEVAEKTERGVHTTVTAKLVPLSFGGWCIDSPGIQSFGLWNLEKRDLMHFFSEIFEVGRGCKYPDCTHTTEPSCAVKEAVEKKEISSLRYNSYRKLFDELER